MTYTATRELICLLNNKNFFEILYVAKAKAAILFLICTTTRELNWLFS